MLYWLSFRRSVFGFHVVGAAAAAKMETSWETNGQ